MAFVPRAKERGRDAKGRTEKDRGQRGHAQDGVLGRRAQMHPKRIPEPVGSVIPRVDVPKTDVYSTKEPVTLDEDFMKNNQLVGKMNGNTNANVMLVSRVIENEADQNELRTSAQKLNNDTMAIGEIDIQLAMLEAKKTELIQSVFAGRQTLEKRTKEIAKSVGLDMDDPNAGRWTVDLSQPKLTFQRVS